MGWSQGNPSWIDLTDIANEGDWVTHDGSTPNNPNWALRAPNGGTNENCGYHYKDAVTGAIVFDDTNCNLLSDGWCTVCQRACPAIGPTCGHRSGECRKYL